MAKTTFLIIAPRYTHDCDACTFVGYDNESDVYASCCGSVICRYGDSGEEYCSFPLDIARRFPSYSAAVALVDHFQRL